LKTVESNETTTITLCMCIYCTMQSNESAVNK